MKLVEVDQVSMLDFFDDEEWVFWLSGMIGLIGKFFVSGAVFKKVTVFS
jgi:hypothetical protein